MEYCAAASDAVLGACSRQLYIFSCLLQYYYYYYYYHRQQYYYYYYRYYIYTAIFCLFNRLLELPQARLSPLKVSRFDS